MKHCRSPAGPEDQLAISRTAKTESHVRWHKKEEERKLLIFDAMPMCLCGHASVRVGACFDG